MKSSAPAYAPNDGVIDMAEKTLGGRILSSLEAAYEVSFTVDRDSLVETMTLLRDTPGLEYQQLMEIAGVDYPDRPDRFEVVYCLLSLTRNHRIRVHVQTDEVKPVPSVTGIWPVAGWLEREVYDMNSTPYMSYTSRSSQPATGQIPVTDGTGLTSSVWTWTRMRWLRVSESRQ